MIANYVDQLDNCEGIYHGESVKIRDMDFIELTHKLPTSFSSESHSSLNTSSKIHTYCLYHCMNMYGEISLVNSEPVFFEIAANPRIRVDKLYEKYKSTESCREELVRIGEEYVLKRLSELYRKIKDIGCNTVYIIQRQKLISLSADSCQDNTIGCVVYMEIAIMGGVASSSTNDFEIYGLCNF